MINTTGSLSVISHLLVTMGEESQQFKRQIEKLILFLLTNKNFPEPWRNMFKDYANCNKHITGCGSYY